MKTRLKIALFFITCLQAGFSFAQNIYWETNRLTSSRALTAQKSCDKTLNPSEWYDDGSYFLGDTLYKCRKRRISNNSSFSYDTKRYGTTCPEGTVYDPNIYGCVDENIPPPNDCEAGKK